MGNGKGVALGCYIPGLQPEGHILRLNVIKPKLHPQAEGLEYNSLGQRPRWAKNKSAG